MNKYKYFNNEELICHCGDCDSSVDNMDESFMKKIIILREICNFPFSINSAHRCSRYNKLITGKETGEHVIGKALDIKIAFANSFKLLDEGIKIGFRRFGIKQYGDVRSRYIHIGGASEKEGYPSPIIWSYP